MIPTRPEILEPLRGALDWRKKPLLASWYIIIV